MLLKHFLIIIWLLIIHQFVAVFCQVCVETKMAYREVPETYLYTYMEAYEKPNCLFWCTGTRVATAIGTRNVRKLFPEQVNVCCEGYIKDENSISNSIHCKPYCSPSCKNGYCKSPGVCSCNPGYMPDIFDHHNCKPLCIKDCHHGTCIAPNTCECHSGYNLENDICEPECSEPCYNGSCVAPETCQCHPGYKMSENNTCEPYCVSYTASGECVVTLTCESGWTKVIKDLIEVCEPACTEPCVNGNCVAPDVCECLNGYKKSTNSSCEPYCSSGCVHSSCISPEICVCEPGWYRKESSGACLPHCDYKCGNGTCVGPNVCECFPGYGVENKRIDQDETETSLCAPICQNCEGTCISPGRCVCDPPQETMLVAADGGPCDCLDDCSNGTNKCERTICVDAIDTTTATESTTYDVVEDTTLTSDIYSTTGFIKIGVEFESSTVENEQESENNELIIEKASWSNSKWFYGIGTALIVVILIVMAAAIIRRKYSKSIIDRNILNRQDNVVSTVHYKQKSAA